MKKFKKIYIEITNYCNLHCFFCPNENRDNMVMSPSSFEKVLKKIDSYTDYLYFHVKGEPLLHDNLEEILHLSKKYYKKVNVTTNGTLLGKRKDILKKFDNIRQINISLHNMKNNLDNLFEVIDELLSETNIIFCLRLWNGNDKSNDKLWDFLKRKYGYLRKENKICHNMYIDCEEYFIWPSLDNSYFSEKGRCKALSTHIGILADGTVIPCCLDEAGIINLGNIFESNLEDILNSKRASDMALNFKNDKKCELLCQKCNFYK